jgi:hypothetical protein
MNSDHEPHVMTCPHCRGALRLQIKRGDDQAGSTAGMIPPRRGGPGPLHVHRHPRLDLGQRQLAGGLERVNAGRDGR